MAAFRIYELEFRPATQYAGPISPSLAVTGRVLVILLFASKRSPCHEVDRIVALGSAEKEIKSGAHS
jgi:hypothetical protein